MDLRYCASKYTLNKLLNKVSIKKIVPVTKPNNLKGVNLPITIFISGLDGAGKTTHARKLVTDLTALRIKSRYIWIRGKGKVFFSLPLLILCRLFNLTKIYKIKNGIEVSEYPFYVYMPLRLLWPWLQYIDCLLFHAVYITMSRIRSTSLIIDRGIIDTYVDVLGDVHKPIGSKLLERLFINLIPKTALVILLDIDVTNAIKRKKDIINIDNLQMRREIYNMLQKKYGWKKISTDQNFNITNKYILKFILNSLIYEE